MTQETDKGELRERLDLIESMIAEGRRVTGNWGWAFVLWGVAYYAAFVWAWLGWNPMAAWPVTMITAGVVTAIVASRRARRRPRKGTVRAVSSIWLVMGVLLLVLMMSLAFSGRLDNHISLAVVGTMLAVANGTSSLILRWKMQFACALAWLGMAEVGCFGTQTQGLIAFLAATFFCQIIFGIYAMISESRQEQLNGEAHA
ncbi:MAG TPA: hypothetical protein VGR47_11850 [Terracidiphilus sp.]|nr:hypothetical protein [Terracidiphilus sp.]